MKSAFRNFVSPSRRAAAFVVLSAILIAIPQTRAADATWISGVSGNWNEATNWSGGTAPGATNTTNNTDIATFGGAITSTVVVTNDAGRNVGGITFDYSYTNSGNGYSLKNDILLSDGGVIKEISTVSPSSSRISRLQNDIRIQGDGASAYISNNATSGNVRMYLNGVYGNSTSSNTTTLFLGGNNTAPNTFGSALFDGANGGSLAVVKNGSGYWRLTASNSDYSGGTTLNAGRLQYSAGTNATSSVFGTGTLYLNGGTLQNTESAATPLFTTVTNAIVVGGDFQFSTKAASSNTTIFSGNVDLTGATRQINVDGAANSAVVLSGVISNGGLTKVGSQTLVLQGDNTFTGATTVTSGALQLDAASGSALGATASVTVSTNSASPVILLLSKSDQVNDSATVTLSGGTIKRESGVSEEFGNLTVTKSSILDYGSGTEGTLTFGTYTPSALLTVTNFFEGNKLVFANDLSSTVTNSSYFSFDNGFNYNWNGSAFTITAIPEASAYVAAAMLTGMLMLYPLRRRYFLRRKPACADLEIDGCSTACHNGHIISIMKTTRPDFSKRSGWASVLAVLSAALLAIPQSRAADATWVASASGDWTNSANWSGGNVPGATNTTNNTDIATFGGPITTTNVVTIDPNRNIGGITFDYDYTGTNDGYSLKNEILLSDGGVIKEISTVVPTGSRVSRLQNDVRIQGDGASVYISNNATSANVRMYLNGVRGNSTNGHTTTLYLGGSNIAANTFGSALRDGANGGNLAVVKNGSGYWRLTASNSDYSGGTTLNAGRLQYSAGTNATSSVFGTGPLFLNGGMLQNTESAATPLFTTVTNAIVVGGDFQFSTKAASSNTTIFSGNVDLTGATRQINVDGAANSAVVLSGVISNGGLTKVGSQTLVLQGHNIYTGNTTVNSGTLELGTNGWLTFEIGLNGVNTAITSTTNTGTVNLDGTFAFDLSGADATFGNSWSIVNTNLGLTANYGGTFNVDGFSDSSGIWTKTDGGNLWTFTQSTGVLDVNAVPEPGTVALVSLGLGVLAFSLRRRMRW